MLGISRLERPRLLNRVTGYTVLPKLPAFPALNERLALFKTLRRGRDVHSAPVFTRCISTSPISPHPILHLRPYRDMAPQKVDFDQSVGHVDDDLPVVSTMCVSYAWPRLPQVLRPSF